MTFRQSAADMSATCAKWPTPALFTSTSSPPKCSTAASIARPASSAFPTSARTARTASVENCASGFVEVLLIAPRNHHASAALDERGGDRQSNPARTTRDDGDD